MKIALTGAHGTGKSSVFESIRDIHPEYAYFSEAVRHQMPALGYSHPYEYIAEHGIGIFEVMNVNAWAVLDPALNPLIKDQPAVITDRSAIDNLAYYETLKKYPDLRVQDLLGKLATHYTSLIDKFVYFPISSIPLTADQMRPDDVRYQAQVDNNIKRAFRICDVPESKVHHLKSKTVADRTEEVLSLIEPLL